MSLKSSQYQNMYNLRTNKVTRVVVQPFNVHWIFCWLRYCKFPGLQDHSHRRNIHERHLVMSLYKHAQYKNDGGQSLFIILKQN